MKDLFMSDVNNYTRYESSELIQWKEYSVEEQLTIVKEHNNPYKEKVEVCKVHHQSIEVSLFMKKEEVYTFLVQYETYMREKLGGFPIIILLKDRADENKKRK